MAGYEQPGKNAIEIRCNQAKTACSEAYANLLHHDEGEDIEAMVFNYEVVEWTDTLLHAIAKGAMAECTDRNLYVSLDHKTASLELMPQDGCEGDIVAAVLVGPWLRGQNSTEAQVARSLGETQKISGQAQHS